MHSIKTKILGLSLILLFCLGAAFALYSTVTTSAYQHVRLEGIRRTIKFEAERANRLIAEIDRGVLQLAASAQLFRMSQSISIGEHSALEFLLSFPTAIGGGFWFEPYAYNPGRYRMGIHAYYDREDGHVHLDYIADDYDYHNMDWYREVIGRVSSPYQVVWIRPYIDDTTFKFVTTAGSGIFNDEGQVIGISIVDWEIEGITQVLTTIKPTENSIVVVYDPVHDYIVAGTMAQSDQFPQVRAANASRRHIPGILQSASETWLSEYDVGVSMVTISDNTYFALDRAVNNGWHLIVYAPVDEIFAETEHLNRRFTLALTFISAAILCFAYFLISKIIYMPIKKLTSSVAQISLGNLDIRAEEASNDELGMLARAFNKMTSDLQSSIEAYTREHAEKERIDAELGIAAGIQASMLPCVFPPFPNRDEFDIYAAMHPAKEVGGDFYDFFFVDKNTLAVVIADVSGKGVGAALFMVIAKTLIKNNSGGGKSPAEVFSSVNRMLCDNNEASMFVTALIGYYKISRGKFVFVNAGHNPPLLKKANSEYEFLRTKPCPVLGWKENSVYIEEEISFQSGDTIYLYTDGVTEAMDSDGDFFSEARLLDALARANDYHPTELLDAIKQEIDSFAGGAEQADDITMLALEARQHGAPGVKAQARKELHLAAVIENLDKTIDFVNAELKRHNCPQNIQNDINIAVEEAFTNIVNYAYETSGNISIYLEIQDKKAVISLEDSGKAQNPLEQATPDLDKPLLERQIGGLGIYFIKKLMDNVTYTHQNGKNLLTMVKKIG
ncbi:MAG: SpoIIE family protein phosphatase [Treponema sp.]|nr:SpoIIE family protein phosphatase [Treponema sp.]